jgi:hypothetical protein
MPAKILSEDDMDEARRLYEREGWGYGRVAAAYEVSKPTVQGWAKRGGWQRGINVLPMQKGGATSKADAVSGAKFTEVPQSEGAERVAHTPGAAPEAPQSARASLVDGVVAEVVAARPAPAPASAYADEIQVPDGLDELAREEWLRASIVARQREINARHLKEIAFARSKLYASLKAAGTKEGAGAALGAQRNIAAMVSLHAAELEAELQRVRLEVAEFIGKPVKPTACRIIVHQSPGVKIGGGEVPADAVKRIYGPSAVTVERKGE